MQSVIYSQTNQTFGVKSVYNEIDIAPVKYLEDLIVIKKADYRGLILSGTIFNSFSKIIKNKTEDFLFLPPYAELPFGTNSGNAVYSEDFIKTLCNYAGTINPETKFDFIFFNNLCRFENYYDIFQNHFKDDIKLFLFFESRKYTSISEKIKTHYDSKKFLSIKDIFFSIYTNFESLKSLIETINNIEETIYNNASLCDEFIYSLTMTEGFLYEISHTENLSEKNIIGLIKDFVLKIYPENYESLQADKAQTSLSAVMLIRFFSLLKMTLACTFLSENALLEFRFAQASKDLQYAKFIKRCVNRIPETYEIGYAIETYSLVASWIMILAAHIRSYQAI